MRKECIVCGEKLLEIPLYICKNMPAVSQNLPTREELEDDEPIDMNLCQCSGCGLVQFDCDPVPYYKDSTRAGERSEVLIQLRRSQYKHIIERYGLQRKKIIEIGAGKGGFLKTLKEMEEYQVQEYGIENNPEFVRIACEEEKVNVQLGNPEDKNTVIEGAPFDAFVSFAYPARLVRPNDMLKLIHDNLAEEGIGLVMVPSLEHLLKQGGFFDITRDHIAYYSMDTLRFLFQKNGFDVLEQGEVSKLYIYAVVRKRTPIDIAAVWWDVEPLATQFREFVEQELCSNRRTAVWCAGHFAFTVLSISGVGNQISYIIDNAEFKKGRYAPGSHIPIVGPEHFKVQPVDTIIILGPIYIDEIVKEIKEKCSEKVKIATMDKQGITQIT